MITGSNFLVCIDAGHGGADSGATYNGKYLEKDYALQVARYVMHLLEGDRIAVFPTRYRDYFLPIGDRTTIANRSKADIFVSIHFNGAKDPSAHGIETFHFRGSTQGKILASKVQSKMIQTLDGRNRGIKTGSFSVLSGTVMPAILVEPGFITNEKEKNKIITRSYQLDCARAITNGILSYLREVNK